MSRARPYTALFLCTGNSARSVFAECILNREGRGRFVAHSAGSQPKSQIHPLALALLERQRFDTRGLRSKSWDEFAGPHAPKLDFVFTVCDNAANETCPVWPGQPVTAHWGIPDPAALEGTPAAKAQAFADALGALTARIRAFVMLPLTSLDAAALRSHLDQIGARTNQ